MGYMTATCLDNVFGAYGGHAPCEEFPKTVAEIKAT